MHFSMRNLIRKEKPVIEWVKARCPECGLVYEYPKAEYKPETCRKFDCIQKHLHPELKRVPPARQTPRSHLDGSNVNYID